MPKSQLPTPDSISARQIQTQYTDLDPAAKAMSEFQGATLVDPAAPYQTSMFTQLGNALKDLNPALSNVGVEYAKVRDAEAEAKAIRLKTENPEMLLAQAVSRGNLPAGASPAFIRAFNMTDLKTKAQQFNGALYKAYDESGLAGVDDPAAFDNFATKFRADYWKNATQNEKGIQVYTDLEIEKSQFGQMIDNHVGALRGQHVQHRVAERTQQGLEAASNLAGTHLDEMFLIPQRDRNLKEWARKMTDSFDHPVTGITTAGISYTARNQALVDQVANKIAETGDMTLAEILDHIPTSQGNFLAGTKYAREKMKHVTDAVVAEKYREETQAWQHRERTSLEAVGLGPEAQARIKAQDEKRKLEIQKRQDRDYEHSYFMAQKAERAAFIDQTADAKTSYILKGLELGDLGERGKWTAKYVKHFDWMRDHAPKEWEALNTYIQNYRKEKGAYVPTPESIKLEAVLRSEMSLHPESFRPTRILRHINEGTISPDGGKALWDDWDRIKVHVDHPFMQNEEFQQTLKRAGRAAQQDAGDEYGGGAVRAEQATAQMRRLAYAWLENNPEGSFKDFNDAMSRNVDVILQDYATEYAKDREREKTRKETVTVTPPDTRGPLEKLYKSAPEPVKQSTALPEINMETALQKLHQTRPQEVEELVQMMKDPNVNPDVLDAEFTNLLYPYFKGNGRDAVDFSKFKKKNIGKRGVK